MYELLLDSSYLFPIFGVALEYRDFESVFSKLPDRLFSKIQSSFSYRSKVVHPQEGEK